MRAEELLPDQVNHTNLNGVTVRKGTVGAFLCNARVWCDHNSSAPTRLAAEQDIVDALPALRALGVFEVMEIRDAGLRTLIEAH
jgi:hypothetical protein